jgi:hypothetical protein
MGGEEMQKAKYPKEQLHRIQYTKLTKEQIGQKLVPAAAGPVCASEYSDVLAGKRLKIVADNGPALSYAFKDKRTLTLAENGGSPVESGYGALTLKQVVFFSHMVPKTQKGYNVFIDLESNLATVFEVWFSSGIKGRTMSGREFEIDNREVQRQIYYGYVEVPGKEAPKERHHLTNRIEGKGFHWKQDTGVETLEFYPSIISSSFVELTRFGGELTFCGPSDYIMMNDHMFIYDRTECESSGIMAMYVMDLLTVTQAGMRLGFNDTDALEYYMFKGSGEIVGQIAKFEPFSYHGEKIALGPAGSQTARKGDRPVYRPVRDNPPMTEQEVYEAAQKKSTIFSEEGMMGGTNKMPPSDLLAGKELTVRCDYTGPVLNYRFDDIKKLRWRYEGESEWREQIYQAFEPDEGMIFFAHMCSGTRPAECKKIVLDFATGLASCVNSKLGTEYMANEVSYNITFGVIEMEGLTAPRYWRHNFTEELTGRAFTWNYSDMMASMHVYSTPHSYSWTIFMENQALGMQWSSPAQFVKLRDGVYLFSWVEEACNGTQGTIVINTHTMHDAGFGLHVDKNGLSLSTIGAFARNAGQYDLTEFMEPKRM